MGPLAHPPASVWGYSPTTVHRGAPLRSRPARNRPKTVPGPGSPRGPGEEPMTNPSLRNLAISLAALALVAGPSWSSRVVQIRVGNHPTFTRVVFELDAKAGYQIERKEADGVEELVVTLSAASAPRKLSSQSAMVAGVEVEPSGQESVARVRLRRPAPLVKEMLLTSPPRIVLDLMLPEGMAKAGASKPSGKPTTAAAPKSTAPPVTAAAPKTSPPPATSAAPKKTAETTPAPTPIPEPEAAPRVVAKRDATEAARPPVAAEPAKPRKPAGASAEPLPAAKPPAPVVTSAPPDTAAGPPRQEETAAPSPRAVAAPPAPPPGSGFETALEGNRIVEPGSAPPQAEGEAGPEAKAETAAQTQAPAPPPVVTPPSEQPATTPKPNAKAPAPAPAASKPGFFSGLFDLSLKGSNPLITMALVGAGALFFVIVVVMLLRKHSRPTSLDALEMARAGAEPEEMGDAFSVGPSSQAGAGMGEARDAFPHAGSRLFEDDSEKGDMEMAAQLPIERERARASHVPAGGDSDLGPLVRELERRMGQLESRLDQVNEARERLERQVTAQSEELRVQRAAIARTQRALRGMNRGGEEQATEPALRDPSKPSSTRP